MAKVTHDISSRKTDHIRINLEKDVRSGLTTGLERYRFIHRALPELDLEQVSLQTNLFGKTLAAPLLISSITGGAEQATLINARLAQAAQQAGIAMGVGSQRAALEQPELAASFQVRRYAPGILLFANLGAVQLNYGYTVDHCRRAVEMIEADALILHLNPLQEAIQPEGEVNFAHLARQIEQVCRSLAVPVIAKEVGWGFSQDDVRLLANCGVSAIDVAGAGGTSWSQVEMHRARSERLARLASAFIDWGIPTAEAIQNVRTAAPGMPILASGGLRSGVEVAKCLALGASLAGLAGPFLKAAVQSTDEVSQTIADMCRETQICMFACGAGSLAELRQDKLISIG